MPSRLPGRSAALLFLLAFVVSPLPAQKRRSANLDENIQLPADFAMDYQLGLTMRSQIHGSNSLLTDTPMNLAGDAVFKKLINDGSVQNLGLPYRWNFTIVNDDSINAHSLPDGEICVGSGLAKLIGTNPGLWAAVLSHETEHTARRRWVKKYLYELYIQQRLAYYQARVYAGDKNANWSIAGLRIAAPIGRARLSRNLEHDADIQGMMLMAHEGYHPDYVFSLHHLMRASTGEQSKFAAFFSTHPRWQTRDQRDDKAYSDALAEYNQFWPDPNQSPGGSPPTVAFAGAGTALENRQSKTADLTLPVYCRNATEPVLAIIFFEKDHKFLKSTSPEFSDSEGDLIFRQEFQCSEKTEATPLVVHLPATLVPKDERKVEARVEIMARNGAFLDEFKPLTVHFPRP
jgi:Peptidase family M48